MKSKGRKNQMKRKWWAVGIILLFVGLCFLSSTAMGKTLFYAHVECYIDGVPSDAVTWKYASPDNSYMKWLVAKLDFNTTKGNGSMIIKPIARPAVHYDFPEDFTSLEILFIYNYLGGIFIKLEGENYNFMCRGHGLFVEVS
jgi:hypothetical protein